MEIKRSGDIECELHTYRYMEPKVENEDYIPLIDYQDRLQELLTKKWVAVDDMIDELKDMWDSRVDICIDKPSTSTFSRKEWDELIDKLSLKPTEIREVNSGFQTDGTDLPTIERKNE